MLVSYPRSRPSRRGRGAGHVPSFAVAAVTVSLLASLLVGIPQAAAIDPIPEDAPTEGEKIVVDFYSEPEFLLTAGAERWNIRNTPDGTIAAGYGVPEDAIHDAYARTGRYDPLDTAPTGRILDISVRQADPDPDPDPFPDLGLDHSWAFVRKANGAAEVWGPADLAYPDRYVIEAASAAPEDQIQGGTVISDAAGIPHALLVTADGRLLEAIGNGTPTQVGNLDVGGATVVGAVARDHAAYDRPAYNIGTPRTPDFDVGRFDREILPGTWGSTTADSSVLTLLLDSGEVVVTQLGDGVPSAATSLGSTFSAVDLAETSTPVIDVDFSCFAGEYNDPAFRGDLPGHLGGTDSTFVDEPINGSMASSLGCPTDVEPRLRDLAEDASGSGRSWDGDEPARGLGRISVAVGLQGIFDSQRVDVLTSADRVLFARDGRAPDGRNTCGTFRDQPCAPYYDLYTRAVGSSRVETACAYSGGASIAPGTFDVRTVVSVTHVGCVRPDPANADQTEIQTYIEPAIGGPLVDGDPLANDDALVVAAGERGVQTGIVQRRTFNRLAQPEPGFTGSETITETYERLGSLSIQLQFPCETLLGRPLGIAPDARLYDCQSNKALVPPLDDTFTEQVVPAASPNGQVSYTIAGYGSVDGERRLFVDNEPNIERFTSLRDAGLTEDAEQDTENDDPLVIPPAPAAEDVSWTIEPADYLASDIATLNHDPLDPAVDSFEPYSSPLVFLPPPVLLTQIPRGLRTPMTVRIDSTSPRIEETKTLPIAVLQAPPTVRGLGQQDDFTPEFAASSTTGAESTTSKATRVGAHAGIEGVVSTGIGGPTGHIRGGLGAAASYQFMNEIEESLTKAFEVTTTEGYGGAFDDHTVITRAMSEYVWDATVIEDPAGFTTGEQFAYGVPAGEITQSVPLSTLAAESPGLYGDGGVFRPSINAIIGGIEIGNPFSYPQTGESQPQAILRSSETGGACNGGYAGPDERTPPDGELASVVDPENPYYSSDPSWPTGPSVITSGRHVVTAGNALTESAEITFDTSTSESKLTSKSHDWGVSILFKLEYAQDNIVSTAGELTVSVGADAGFSTGSGISDTLGTGSGLSTVMGNIPLSPADKPWLDAEQYGWRMYMCKAQLGPAGLTSDVWVQGYVVDGYNGSGGIDELADVAAESPVNSAVAFADPTEGSSGAVTTCDAIGVRDNRFEWDQSAGTVDVYAVEFTNVSAGGGDRHLLSDREAPAEFDPENDKLDCAGVLAGDFVDGDLYRWRTVIDGFVDNRVTSDWEFFRPQVWPPDQALDLRTPIVNPDHSVTVDIDDPTGVDSLVHDATIYELDGEDRSQVAQRGSITNGRYRTPTLEPGLYEAEVVGHNSHRLDGGERADTAPAIARFRVEEGITSQFTIGGCDENPCTTAETVEFTDESLGAGDIPITEWSWYFGDGSTSTEQNPSHRFVDLPGDDSDAYDVYLTVTDAIGRTDSVTQQVSLRSATPEIDASGLETDIGVDQILTVSIAATDPDNEGRDPDALQIPTIEWDLDDDGIADVTETGFDSSTDHTFGAAGDYPVAVTATDPYGETTTHAFTVTVHEAPQAQFSDTACEAPITCTPTGTEISFDPAASSSTAGDIQAWEWDFGDGTTLDIDDPADQVIAHAYDRAGDYTMALRVQDRFGQWSAPLERVLAITNRPATVDVSSDSGFVVPIGAAVTFTVAVDDPDGDPDLATVSWVFEPGDPAVDGSSATHTWDTLGDKTVSVAVIDDNNETTTQQFTVTVAEPAPDLGPCATANPDAAAFAHSALTDLVGNAPPARVETLCPRATGSAGRAAVARELAFSADYLRNVVDRGYRKVLGRAPDASGSAYWVRLLASGDLTTADFVAHLYGSVEYFAKSGNNVDTWVASLYRALLYRSPDPSGAAYWADTARRIGRPAVAGFMHQSLESRLVRVRDAYRQFLNRATDSGGERYWAEVIRQNGGDDITLVVYLVSSAEYFSRSQRRWGR